LRMSRAELLFEDTGPPSSCARSVEGEAGLTGLSTVGVKSPISVFLLLPNDIPQLLARLARVAVAAIVGRELDMIGAFTTDEDAKGDGLGA